MEGVQSAPVPWSGGDLAHGVVAASRGRVHAVPVMTRTRTTLLILASTLFACDGKSADAASATGELKALGDSGVTGKATFKVMADGKVHVDADVSGLTPGKHGFHVHEFGDCSAADGMSAGGHFNPEGHDHGAPGAKSHPGDFGNLEADANGRATLALVLDQGTVDAGPVGIVGRGLIVHADPDDLTSQPVGKAGARVACAVIKADKGETTPVVKAK